MKADPIEADMAPPCPVEDPDVDDWAFGKEKKGTQEECSAN